MTDAEWSELPFARWLEMAVRDAVALDPEGIALGVIGGDGEVYTAYWEIGDAELRRIMQSIGEDERRQWIQENREEILAVLNEEDGDDDEDGGEAGWTMSDF